MNITLDEKLIIKKYLSDPQNYMEEQYLHLLPETYPDGTKLTRYKPNKNGDARYRELLIPQENFEDAVVIPLCINIPDDPMEHSCTVIGSKMFFHQNVTESTEVPPTTTLCSKFSFLCSSPKKSVIEPLPEDPIQKEKAQNYYKYQIDKCFLHATKISVKTAIDMNNNRYCLLSKAATHGRFLPKTEQLEAVRQRVGYFMPKSCVYRCDDTFYKYIEIVPYKGQDLASLSLELTPKDKTKLAEPLILACLEQIAKKGIIHTDLKPSNICILNQVITIIDFDNAFIPDLGHASAGLGTPGYLAPEFFKRPQDANRQYELFAMGNEPWFAALKPDFRELFTSASDIFTLGQILLDDLELPADHSYYGLAEQMSSEDPSQRPTWLEIEEACCASVHPNFHEQINEFRPH